MPLLPASPRRRRRLGWAAAAAAVLAAGAATAFLIPGHSPPSAAPRTYEGPAQLAAATRVNVTAADRRGIDATLDRFLPAALERKDPATAWALAGPELRSGSTLAEWRRGTTPIPYYPMRERTFHHWQTIDVGARYVVFNLLLHPKKGARVASYVFSGEVVKRHGVWLVNRLYTIAIMNRLTPTTHEIGPADFAPPPPGPSPPGKAVLGPLGIVPVVGILSLILLLPLCFGVAALVRARRFRKAGEASRRRELPPLPSSGPAAADATRVGAARD